VSMMPFSTVRPSWRSQVRFLAPSSVAKNVSNSTKRPRGVATVVDVTVRDEAVRLVTERTGDHGSLAQTCVEVATTLGIPRSVLRGWMRDVLDQRAGRRPADVEDTQFEALRAEVRTLPAGRARLRAVAAFHSGLPVAQSA
jgi:hypothetical protein